MQSCSPAEELSACLYLNARSEIAWTLDLGRSRACGCETSMRMRKTKGKPDRIRAASLRARGGEGASLVRPSVGRLVVFSYGRRSSGKARPEAEAAFLAMRRRTAAFQIPTGGTVFDIPSTPWLHTVRPMGPVRPGFSGVVFLLEPRWSAGSREGSRAGFPFAG